MASVALKMGLVLRLSPGLLTPLPTVAFARGGGGPSGGSSSTFSSPSHSAGKSYPIPAAHNRGSFGCLTHDRDNGGTPLLSLGRSWEALEGNRRHPQEGVK